MSGKTKSDILPMIKKSGAVRNFNKKKISKEILRKILDAGKWSLSVLGIQPWYFVCILERKIIKRLSSIISDKSKELADSIGIITRITSKALRNTRVVIAIYNNKAIQKRALKYGEFYVERARKAELQVIGAAVQNMFLEANSLGLGAIWVDSPTFCSEEINSLIGEDKELIAFLLVGYTDTVPVRSQRSGDVTRIIE